MKLPRDLQGTSLAQHLCRNWAYTVSHQTGSHIILDTGDPAKHRISIPSHRPLRVGTLSAILESVANHKQVTRDEILRDL